MTRRDPLGIFSGFTTTGSGQGLGIVCGLVGSAYGVHDVPTLIEQGYVGAELRNDEFIAWFHRPVARDAETSAG